MLRYLVEHAGRVVTQDELLWPDTFVQPEVLRSHIRDIRSALEDDPKSPRFIETLPRRGYHTTWSDAILSLTSAGRTFPSALCKQGREEHKQGE